MDGLEGLARGDIPDSFAFKYESVFDPSSPWSLLLTFLPETASLDRVDFKPASEEEVTEVLEPSITEFIENTLTKLQWSKELCGSEDPLLYFLKLRLRITDTSCRLLHVPANLSGIKDESWINGIVRVLQLWRRLNGNSAEPSLIDFEEWDPETAFDALIAFEPLGWNLRQRLEFLVMPYLRYKHRTDLVQAWAQESENLAAIKDAVFAPELASALLYHCLQSSIEDWRTVEHVIDNIRAIDDDDDDSSQQPVTQESLTHPSASTLKFVRSLVAIAKSGKVQASKFQQLADWSLGSAELQEDVLVRFLQVNNYVSAHEINSLRETIFSHLDEETILRESLGSSLEKTKIMHIQANTLKTHPELVREEVLALVHRFEHQQDEQQQQQQQQQHPTIQLPQVLAGLELVDGEPELKAKYERLRSMSKTFGIDPQFALTHEPMEIVTKALETDNAYLRFTDLVKYIAGEENSAKAAEQCVEAALASDDFDAAVEFIERKFVQTTSPSAWIAFYQVGKFVSPNWDLPRGLDILEKQQKYLSTALSLCPESDILSVLRTWSSTDKELAEVKAQQARPERSVNSRESSVSTHSSSATTAAAAVNSTEAAGSEPRKVGVDGARDHISNLLVSGIGWAIGANK